MKLNNFKIHKIKYYNALVNKEQASLGFVIDTKDHDISFFKDKELFYEVDPNNLTVYVFSDTHKISFGALTKELIYYAYKTESLVIFIGTKQKGINFKYVYEAFIK